MGICLKVLALPTPAKKNTASIPHRNFENSETFVGANWNDVYSADRAIPSTATSVTFAPPTLSAIGPASTRAADPTRAPRNA